MGDKKPRTIKMTDEAYNTISCKAKERKLPLGDFILEVTISEQCGIYSEIMCRLLTIRELAIIPMEQWNDEIKNLYNDCAEGLMLIFQGQTSRWFL